MNSLYEENRKIGMITDKKIATPPNFATSVLCHLSPLTSSKKPAFFDIFIMLLFNKIDNKKLTINGRERLIMSYNSKKFIMWG